MLKKPNSRDKNIIISIESLPTLMTKFAVCKNVMAKYCKGY